METPVQLHICRHKKQKGEMSLKSTLIQVGGRRRGKLVDYKKNGGKYKRLEWHQWFRIEK